MEISYLQKSALKIKSKNALLSVGATLKNEANASIYLHDPQKKSFVSDEAGVVIAGPGEYEVGGIKIKAQLYEDYTVYSLIIEGTSVLLGVLSDFEKIHSKLQEHDIILVEVDKAIDPSFLSGLGLHQVVFYGENAKESAEMYAKENLKTMGKIVITKEKFLPELETILLA